MFYCLIYWISHGMTHLIKMWLPALMNLTQINPALVSFPLIIQFSRELRSERVPCVSAHLFIIWNLFLLSSKSIPARPLCVCAQPADSFSLTCWHFLEFLERWIWMHMNMYLALTRFVVNTLSICFDQGYTVYMWRCLQPVTKSNFQFLRKSSVEKSLPEEWLLSTFW